MPKSAIEGCSKLFDVEPLIHPLAVASLKARKAASVVALESQVGQPVGSLHASAGERCWVDVQIPAHVVLAPLKASKHNFKVTSVHLLYDLGFQRAVGVSGHTNRSDMQ